MNLPMGFARSVGMSNHKTCPNCKKVYIPDFTYEDAKPGTIYKEQHITGICSDQCWDEFLGIKHKDTCMCVECLG